MEIDTDMKYKATLMMERPACDDGKVLELRALDLYVIDGTPAEENCIVLVHDAFEKMNHEYSTWSIGDKPAYVFNLDTVIQMDGKGFKVCDEDIISKPCKIWYNTFRDSVPLQEYLDRVFSAKGSIYQMAD